MRFILADHAALEQVPPQRRLLPVACLGRWARRHEPRGCGEPGGHGPPDAQGLVLRFHAGGIEGLRDRPKSGRPAWLDDGQRAALKALVLRGPDSERDGVSSWRAKDLCRRVAARFGVSSTENGMLRLLHDLGLSRQKARPVPPEADLKALARFENSVIGVRALEPVIEASPARPALRPRGPA